MDIMNNLCDVWLSQYYGKLPFARYTLLDRAARTLESNSGGLRFGVKYPWSPRRGIIPSDGYFAGVWNWDSAFHAIGVSFWDMQLAHDQIEIMMSLQKDSGMYPDVWRCPNGEVFDGGSKPPVLPYAVWVLDRRESDLAFLEKAYASFVRNECFWRVRRGGDVQGLFHYDGESEDPAQRKLYGGWESGWDDSPRWDGGVNRTFAIDLNCYMILFYRCLRDMAVKLGRNEERAVWLGRERRLTSLVESKLWSEEKQCYYDYDFGGERFVEVLTPASFMPLFLGIASEKRASRMAELAAKHLSPGWPSVGYHDPAYDPMGYWRGRTWLNIAYFALKGLKFYGFAELAEAGRNTLLEWVRRDAGSIYENYNSENGLPAGAPRFGWSSVFVIKFLLDWELPLAGEVPFSGVENMEKEKLS